MLSTSPNLAGHHLTSVSVLPYLWSPLAPSCPFVSHALVWMYVCDSLLQWPNSQEFPFVSELWFALGHLFQGSVIPAINLSLLCFYFLLLCIFLYSHVHFSSFFFAFSRRKKEALPLLRPPPLMPPVWRHVLLCLVNYSSLALLQQQLSISRSPPAPSFPGPFSMH